MALKKNHQQLYWKKPH